MPKNLDAYLVKTPPLHPVAVVTVVAAVAAADPEVEVEAAGPEVEAAAGPEAAAAGPEAAAAAAAGPEAEMMMMMTMTMTMTMTMVHHLVDQVRLVVEPDAEFSTIKKWNSNWPKSCKINARWQRDDALPVSRPPILSRPRIRMDVVLP